MKTFQLLIVIGGFLISTNAWASKDSIVTAISAKVNNGYVREKSPDGSFKREYYALTRGDYAPGLMADPSIDKVKFPALAGMIAEYLAKQNYYLAQDSKSANLLLRIMWGTTTPFNDSVYRNGIQMAMSAMNFGVSKAPIGPTNPFGRVGAKLDDNLLLEIEMFEDMRREADKYNARLLGYIDEINWRQTPARFAGAGTAYDELIEDIENERYYVLILAYDFRAAKDRGEFKVLWATRVSVQARGNRFDESLKTMLARASRYFGQNSGRLVRQYELKEEVTLGELKILGAVPDSELQGKKPVEK